MKQSSTRERETPVQASKKRKRTKNTTSEQYQLYLNFMEGDYYLKSGSGTINPTLDDNYHEEKWDELCQKLNAVGEEGPNLSVEEWKKRFSDWKYAVRSKYKKLSKHRNKTGPPSEVKMTAIEKRALGVWGKVVVDNYDGLPETTVNLEENPITDDLEIVYNDEIEFVNCHQEKEVAPPKSTPSKRRYSERPKRLSFLTEKLIESSLLQNQIINKTLVTFANNFMKVQTDQQKIESLRLKFEIAKYKHENPSFSFETN